MPVWMQPITRCHATHIRNSRNISHGVTQKKHGVHDRKALLLGGCISFLQMQESAFSCEPCLQQSKVPVHSSPCVHTMAPYMTTLKKLALHEGCYKMMGSGTSVYAKPVTCRWGIDCANCS